MVPITRRRLLHAAVGLLAGLAGCGRSRDGPSTETPTEPNRRNDGPVPDHYMLRDPSDEPPVLLPRDRDGRGDAATAESPSGNRPENARQHGLVASEDAASRVWITDVEGADEARDFVAATDFDAETLYVHGRSVGECYELELCSVTWSDAEIETRFGSNYRDADVACRADAKGMVSTLIRIPDALDPERVRSHGSGWSSNGCDLGRPRETGTTTEAPNFGPKSAANATEATNATETTEADR